MRELIPRGNYKDKFSSRLETLRQKREKSDGINMNVEKIRNIARQILVKKINS